MKKRAEQEPGRGWIIRVSLERCGAPTGHRTIAIGTSGEVGYGARTPEDEAAAAGAARARYEAALEAARRDP